MTYTRRKRMVIINRRRFITFLVCAMVLSNVLVFGFVVPNITKADMERTSTQVVVCSGDTLWSIAGEYASSSDNIRQTVYDIRKANNLKSSELKVGQTLTVPIE